MKVGQVIEQDVPVQISLRIAKVDKVKREVEGVCTQEVTDVHGEIVDHESMKAALLAWPGNIREMHQPIAVGKAVSVVSDDDAKATILRSRVSKGAPDTWEKVLDGTLSMYSIGGSGKRVLTKKADGSEEKRIFIKNLSEVSFVDNGACPTAKFEIVKSVDGVSTHVQPCDEEGIPEQDSKLPDEPGQPNEIRRAADKCSGCKHAAHAGAKCGAEKAMGSDCDCDLTEKVAAKAVVVVGKTPLGELFEKLASLKGAAQQSPTLLTAIDTAIVKVEAARRDPALVEKRAYPTPYNIEQTLVAIALLERICAEEWWKARETEAGEEDATTDKLQLQVLRNAIELVIAYLMSEFNAQFADLDAEAPTQRADTEILNVAMARRAELVEKAAFELPMVFSKLDGTGQLWLAKAGARHSKSDTQMVQAMHDTAVSLGAVDCAACTKAATTEKAAGATENAVTTEKAAEAAPKAQEPIAPAADAQAAPPAAAAQEPAAAPETPIQNAAGLTAESVQDIVKAAVSEALEVHKATSDKTIADLQAQITKLSNEPMPGGPKARATGTEGTPVHKSIGNTGAALDEADPAQVHAFAEQLAKEAKTPEERERIVTNLLKFQHATGAGAVVMRQSVSRRTE